MSTNNDITSYLSTHAFIPHHMGDYANYGLNMLGTNSIINYNNDNWKFYAFEVCSDNAIYYNKAGVKLILNTRNMPIGITRMEEHTTTYAFV